MTIVAQAIEAVSAKGSFFARSGAGWNPAADWQSA
jgi:hypothetical protein